jgi:hypothetical protein
MTTTAAAAHRPGRVTSDDAGADFQTDRLPPPGHPVSVRHLRFDAAVPAPLTGLGNNCSRPGGAQNVR